MHVHGPQKKPFGLSHKGFNWLARCIALGELWSGGCAPEFDRRLIRMTDMYCSTCGCEMRRLMRESFLQRKVYPLFGYYPWECPLCRDLTLYKVRHVRKRKPSEKDSSLEESGFPQPSSSTPSGISSAKTG
jgi:hypothetical protein